MNDQYLARTLLLVAARLAHIAGMFAANQQRFADGYAPAYGDDAFLVSRRG